MNARDRVVLAVMAAGAAGELELGPEARGEVAKRLADILTAVRTQAFRRQLQAVAAGQIALALQLEGPCFPAFRLPGRRAPGDAFAIVAPEQRRGPRGRAGSASGRGHTQVPKRARAT